MDGDHDRFEALAVGHVLGGLSTREAAEFRGHLLGCSTCRSRVAELRGIADELAAAEREERARLPVRTELPDDGADVGDAAPHAGRGMRLGQAGVLAVVVVLVIGAMAFWNLHLRANMQLATDTVARQDEVLHLLTEGLTLPVETIVGIEGQAATDGERVAVVLVGLPAPRAGEAAVLWLSGGEVGPPQAVLAARAEALGGGVLAASVPVRGARVLSVHVQPAPVDGGPGGEELARVELLAERP